MQRRRSTIFRSEALEYYIQSRERNVLPRIARPPVFLCLWVLLGLCVTASIIAYLSAVPVYVNGSGIVLERAASVLVFVPASTRHTLYLRAGSPVHLVFMGTPGQTINSTLDRVEAGVLSPEDVQRRYGSGDKLARITTGPSIVAWIKLDATFPYQSYAGSVVNVQIQIGTTRALSLLLGASIFNGE